MATKNISKLIDDFKRINAGELILHCIENDGTLIGYDTKIIKHFNKKIDVPIILLGGCGAQTRSSNLIELGVHSLAASSRFIFHGQHKAVLIQYDRF